MTRTRGVTDQRDGTPTAKVTASTLTGAAVAVLMGVLDEMSIEVPANVAASLTVFLGFLAGYIKSSRPADVDH